MLRKDVIQKLTQFGLITGGVTNRNLEFNNCIVVVFFLSD